MSSAIFGKVAIVGPGLVGGSIGMGLKRSGLAGEVIGIGHRQVSVERAVALGAIDRGTLALEEGVSAADLVLLCTGVEVAPLLAARAIPRMRPGSILSDVASTKQQITDRIESLLGNRGVSYLATHPMAGLEKRGIEAARADLFQGSTCLFTPTPHTTPEAKERLTRLWNALGARVKELDPQTHDRLIGQISHLPHVVAATLVNAVSREALEFAATGFRDATRIAAGEPELWAEILLSNRHNIVSGLRSLGGQMEEFAAALDRNDKEAILHILRSAKDQRDSLTPQTRDA
jgi:prephenate dehydrogenase